MTHIHVVHMDKMALIVAPAPPYTIIVSGLIDIGFTTALDVQQRRNELIYITTGSRDLDTLLGGGIETGSITELFGEFRCGKTQLCHTLAVSCQVQWTFRMQWRSMPHTGIHSFQRNKAVQRANVSTLIQRARFDPTEYCPLQPGIYTHTHVDPRIGYIILHTTCILIFAALISYRFGLDAETCLDSIAYARAYNTDHQTSLLVQAAAMMSETRFVKQHVHYSQWNSVINTLFSDLHCSLSTASFHSIAPTTWAVVSCQRVKCIWPAFYEASNALPMNLALLL